jgi:hypothetical protein
LWVRDADLFATVAAAVVATTAIAAIATTTATTAAVTTAAAATTTVTATAFAATATTTAAETTGTRSAFFAGARDVDRERAAVEFVPVEFIHGFLGLFTAAHRDEGKTAGTAGEFVEDNLNDTDGANLAKQSLEVLGGAGEGKIPHVELAGF